MASRGITQVKSLKFVFCDFGGSSRGLRDFFKTDSFYNVINSNNKIQYDISIRRKHHPFIRCEYINGYIKDYPLRNLDSNDVLSTLDKAKNSFGRKAIPHNGYKVWSLRPSIQGQWESNMWNTHKKHDIEVFKSSPQLVISPETQATLVTPYIKKKKINIFVRRSRNPKIPWNL